MPVLTCPSSTGPILKKKTKHSPRDALFFTASADLELASQNWALANKRLQGMDGGRGEGKKGVEGRWGDEGEVTRC